MLDSWDEYRERLFAVLREADLNPGDIRALLALDPVEPRPMGALAKDWACDASNVTWMVDRLEEKGFVERRLNPADRRVKAVVLTPTGVKAKAKIEATIYEPPAYLASAERTTLESLRDSIARTRPAPFRGPPVQAFRRA